MAEKFQVCIADFIADDLAIERAVLGDLAEIQAFNAYSEADLVGKVEAADAIMLFHSFYLSQKIIDTLRQCKLIVRCGVGYDNLDYRFARAKNIPVANVPDYGTEEIADSAIGLALTLVRGIHLCNSRLQRQLGEWTFRQAAPIQRLRGRMFGIIGLGNIGTATAIRARAFGMRVLFYDPYVGDGYDRAIGIERVESLQELLQRSSIVSVHTPLTEETKHMINAGTLKLMPKGSFLVNTSRGGCVDELAVRDAIVSGHLGGAGLDVLPQEPPKADDPLLAAWRDPSHPCYDRLILNPHSAFYSEEGLHDMRAKGAQACKRALLGQPLRNVVN